MRYWNLFGLAAALVCASATHAATLPVSATANGSSRWYEYFSDAFTQLDKSFSTNPPADGAYLISQLPNFVEVGGGVDAFPFEGNFANLGTITYTPPSGGNGAVPVDGLVLDFDQYVADNDNLLSTGYTTALSAVTGTVTFVSGVPTAVNLTANITFTYDATGAGLGLLPYDGTFTITNNSFVLAVDDVNSTGFGDFRYAWDVTGVIAVPEPASLGLLAIGAISLLARRRVRVAAR